MSPILVTGAAGQMGSTGRHLAERLRAEGRAVRAMVRQRDTRADGLAALGCEIVIGDLLDEESVRAAMEGVEVAYFCAPVSDTLLHAATVFALCGRDRGLSRIINVSQMGTKDPILSPATRLHRLSEMIFDWSGVETSHLRATVFLEQLPRFFGPGVKTLGELRAPLGSGRISMVAGEDVGRVAAGIACEPGRFGPGPYHITGPWNFTFEEAAAVIGEVIGEPVRYVPMAPAEWKPMLLSWGLSPHLAAHLDKLYEKGRAGGLDHAVTDVVERVGGRAPMGLDRFVAHGRAAFARA